MVLSDMGIIIFLAFLPLAYPVIYSLIYNPELVRDVKMVVVDQDRSQLSRRLVRELDATQGIRVIGYAPDLPAGRKAVNSHKCYSILEIPEGFERRVGRGEQANAVIYSEMSLLLRYRATLVAATDVMQHLGAQLTEERIDRIVPLAETLAVSGDPMPVESREMGNITQGFDSFIMPGVIVIILQQSLVLAIGMAGGAKRERRRLIGYTAVNYQPSVLMTLLGQAGCYLTLMILPSIWLLHYVPIIFQFPMAGDTLDIFCFIGPMVLGAIFMGFCLQSVVWEREEVFVIWVVTSVLFLFLSGLTWPRYAITGVWRVLSDLVPATWGVEGFVKMNGNGASLSQVSECYWWEWGLVLFWGLCAYCLQRWVVRPTERKMPAVPQMSADPESGVLKPTGDRRLQ